jgi:UDP-glucose 4-epimerase
MDEFLALAYGHERDLDFVIARLFNTVGPRQTGQYGMVVPSFIQRALDGETIEIHGDGSQTRCFCHVADTVRALRGLMETPAATRGEIFNVGSKNKTSILGLAERVCATVGSELDVAYVPYDKVYGEGIEDMLHREPAIEKIRRAIGWAPTRDLDTIIADVIADRRAIAAHAA